MELACTQESEIEAAGWVSLSEYAGQDAFKDVPLHVKLAERCVCESAGHFADAQAMHPLLIVPETNKEYRVPLLTFCPCIFCICKVPGLSGRTLLWSVRS